jgi:arginyl-tRNA synthetase
MLDIEELRQEIKKEVSVAFNSAFGKKPQEVNITLPPDVSMGDFSVSCFSFSKELGQAPAQITSALAAQIKPGEFIKKVSIAGPYLNFKIKENILFGAICRNQIFKNKKCFNKERVMVEYLSPNTNKPLHLGHVRNGVLGIALSNILEKQGKKVIKAELINDRGIAICKSMVAYQKWGDGETPKSLKIKGDRFVGDFYVLYANKEAKDISLKGEAQECLRLWEGGDKKTLALWKKMNGWVYSGFKKTCQGFGFKFDVVYYESGMYKLGKNIIKKGLARGVFEKNQQGAIIFRLPVEEFGKDENGAQRILTLVRDDGTSLYITQDLGVAVKKFKDEKVKKSIYVVANEQDYHFKCLFYILKKLGYKWADDCKHLSYGMVYLPDGKMKSREGNVVDADYLQEEMAKLAKEEILKRGGKSNAAEINKNAKKIGLAAIKFFLLKIDADKDIVFNSKESISFDGMTGPYCQYAFVRAQGILRTKLFNNFKPDLSLLGAKEELALLKTIIQLQDAVVQAAQELNPSFVCRAIYNVAKNFSQFYENCRVVGENKALSSARLALVKATAEALEEGLKIIGIDTPKKM